MNYYPHHIGDFNSATRHLTRIERSIYRDLLDLYYDTERPIMRDMDKLCRLIIARSDEERTAVEQVLNEFFTETDDGWFHARCEEEISRFQAGVQAKSAAGKASAAKRAQKTQQTNNTNPTAVEQPLNSRSPDDEKPLTPCSTNQNQNQNQEPEKEREDAPAAQPPAPKAARATRLATDWRLPDTWMSWALLEQPSWTPDDALRVADSFRDYWAAKGGADARKVDWEATWRNWVRREKSSGLSRTHQAPSRQDRYAADAAIIRDLARGKTEIDMGTIDATR